MKLFKPTKRTMAVALSLALAVTAGCSNNSPTNSGAGESEGQTAGPLGFNLWLGWSATINNNSLVQKYWAEEEPGVAVELEATQGDVMTALNLKMNTGGFEDAAVFSRSETVKNAMMRSNRVLAVEEYFDMPDKYPGLASIPKEYLDRIKDEDGHIWAIPTWYDQNPEDPWPGWASQTWMVRTDVLEEVGMTMEDLETIEGVESYLQAASQVKDEAGRNLIPLSFLMDPNDTSSWNDENALLTAFGVSTSGDGVAKVGDDFIFKYDDPQYKAAYQWMNKMYRDSLLDREVVTDKKERYKEKNKAGRTAMNVGSFFNIDPTIWETLDGPTEPGWFYQVIPYPKVPGVEQVGTNQTVNPNPQYEVYIDKDTENLDAILKFLDYTLTPNPEHQHVVNEGPTGLYWDWMEGEFGKWHYIDETYEVARNSGDAAQKASVTPELYMLSSYNNEWYPWWTYGDTDRAGDTRNSEFTEKVGQMGGVRAAEDYDLVIAKQGGVWERYMPELEILRKEYRAKLIMAADDARFEAEWNAFQDALEKRAHWSEMKAEWHESYQRLLDSDSAM